MEHRRILIKGGAVVTLEDGPDGEGRTADVLIDGSRIAAIGPGIAAGDAEVIDATGMLVMPGFVDTHRHTWQTAFRGIGSDWSLAQYAKARAAAESRVYRLNADGDTYWLTVQDGGEFVPTGTDMGRTVTLPPDPRVELESSAPDAVTGGSDAEGPVIEIVVRPRRFLGVELEEIGFQLPMG